MRAWTTTSNARRRPPGVRPVVAAALTELVRELETSDRRSLASVEKREREEAGRRRRVTRALWLLVPLALASTLFRMASPRLFGIEPPSAEEQRELLRSDLALVVEEIDAYLEDHGALVANLDAIDACYGRGIHFQALSGRHYRLALHRGEETLTYDSEDAGERAP